ncbi:hypothetical protein ACFVZL_24410 [Streptomyces sp. NPDC058320]|uniref:hypothetical protein n=1 Tax=unclassified Streptomyces TaxID=2593676 RepID=UPI00362F4D67
MAQLLDGEATPRHPGGPLSELAPSWAPDEDLRRPAAYKTATTYYRNHAGHLGAAATGNEDAWGCRELGDPVKLIDAMVGCLLGAEQTVIVPGTEHAQDDDAASEAKAAAEARQRLGEWADKELLALRMQQAERGAVRSGDGVYTLAWEPSNRWALLRTHDPGFHFPLWPEDCELDDVGLPTCVHFEWELPEDWRRT